MDGGAGEPRKPIKFSFSVYFIVFTLLTRSTSFFKSLIRLPRNIQSIRYVHQQLGILRKIRNLKQIFSYKYLINILVEI